MKLIAYITLIITPLNLESDIKDINKVVRAFSYTLLQFVLLIIDAGK